MLGTTTFPRLSSRRVLAALALVALAGAGCGQAARPAAVVAPSGALGATGAEGPNWYAVQLHAHSTYSDGVYDVKTMIAQAKEEGLDALGISDHDTTAHWLDPDVVSEKGLTMIRSMEAEDDRGINHMGFHQMKGILGIPHAHRDRMMAEAASRDATIVIHHPANSKEPWNPRTFDRRAHAIEIWNSWFWVPLARNDSGNPHDTDTRDPRHNERAIAWWVENLERGEHIAGIAAADFHRKPQNIASPCTLVYARSRSADALMAGVRAGRTLLVDHPRSERVFISADVNDDGVFEALPGDTVSTASTFRVRVLNGKGRHLLVMRGKRVLRTASVPVEDYSMDLVLPAARGAEAPFLYARLNASAPMRNMRAMTSAIYLK